MPSPSPFPPKPEKRQPFAERSLPQAGESGRDALVDLFFDRLLLPIMMASMFAVYAAVEWVQYLAGAPPQPVAFTLMAVGMIGFALWRAWRLKPVRDQLRQGIEGERHVGRLLEGLREQGYRVFHDLPGKGADGSTFNVDHLLVGPGGVFMIETKTISMPSGRVAVVQYDGRRVLVDGYTPDRDPIAQAEAQARYVRDRLLAQTGRAVDVRPVVLYPGWRIDGRPRRPRVWVLSHKGLPKWLGYELPKLSDADIALLSNGIEVEMRQVARP